jgi:uncharacterized SAM-binding protein YcdF (DUF218 family)
MRFIRTIFSIILLSWGIGFFYFIRIINNYVIDNTTPTEAILVFGNNKQRLYTAAELLKFGYAPLILITSNSNEDPANYKNYLKEQGISEHLFIFEPQSPDYKNYALDTYFLVKRYKIYSIRLVTAAEELPRAIYETTRYLSPINVSIIPHPISSKKKDYFSIFIEYNKYLLIISAPIFGLQDEFTLSYS